MDTKTILQPESLNEKAPLVGGTIGNRVVFTSSRPRFVFEDGADKVAFSRQGLIYAMIIGDGYTAGKKNKYVEFRHCMAQQGYAEWKCAMLRRYVQHNTWIKTKFHKSKGRCLVQVTTPSHHRITAAWKKLYRNGKKTITNEILRKITPFCLAIWFMDDGTVGWIRVHKNGNPFGVAPINFVQLCTHSFTEAENELIAEWLLKSFGIEFSVFRGVGQISGKDLFFLRTTKRAEATKFIRLVAPVVNLVPCMRYKINPPIHTIKTELQGNEPVETDRNVQSA